MMKMVDEQATVVTVQQESPLPQVRAMENLLTPPARFDLWSCLAFEFWISASILLTKFFGEKKSGDLASRRWSSRACKIEYVVFLLSILSASSDYPSPNPLSSKE